MKPIPENFKAIEEVEQLIREKCGDPEAGFNSSLMQFEGRRGRRLFIKAEYRKKTRAGFTQKYYDFLVQAKFCPFSGLPLVDESEG